MKASISRDRLASALSNVSRASSPRSSVRVYGGVQIRAAGGFIELAATDGTLSICALVDANVEDDGTVVVPAQTASQIARLLPQGEVTLETDGSILALSCGESHFTLITFASEDFPTLPRPDVPTAVDREAILSAFSSVARCASSDLSRPVLTGVLCRFEGDSLTVVATDSYRMAVKTVQVETGIEREAIIPASALAELTRIATSSSQKKVEVSLSENQATFAIDGYVVCTRLLAGSFPNYRSIIPTEHEAEATLPRVEVLDAVNRVSSIAQGRTPLRLGFNSDHLHAAVHQNEVGDAREAISSTYEGGPMLVGVDPSFFRDGLELVGGDEARVRLINPLRPLVIEGSENLTYLVMPVRLER